MSWRRAGELARQMAAAARAEADAQGVSDIDVALLQERLRAADRATLVAWVRRRKAQHLDEFADECDKLKDTDITVLERGPRK
jgi:hypothetical protein